MDIDVVYNRDCIEVLKGLGDNSIDAIVTDPPYNLGFMGKKWDNTGIAFNLELWEECLRVIKPGGNLLSFGGTRTYHRMVCAIEDAGFEIRDCVMWVYGSGFPKSLNIGKAVDKLQGNVRKVVGETSVCGTFKQEYQVRQGYRPKNNSNGYAGERDGAFITKGNSEWEGYGTGLKPAYEPIVLAMKPLDGTFAENCLKWGVGGLNIDECRITTEEQITNHSRSNESAISKGKYGDSKEQNTHQTIGQTQGRFPANFIHDGSQAVMELFPQTRKSAGGQSGVKKSGLTYSSNWNEKENSKGCGYGDNGSAARFFYCAKASKKERDVGYEDLEPLQSDPSRKEGNPGGDNPRNRGVHKVLNNHPTVKPLALMEYLVKLVTRPGHIVLDPFIGSGTTAMACVKLGRHYIGCELDKGYYDIAIKRIAQVDK